MILHMKEDVAAVGDFSLGINSGGGFNEGLVAGGKLANIVVSAIDFQHHRHGLNDDRCRVSADPEAIAAIAIAFKRNHRARRQVPKFQNLWIGWLCGLREQRRSGQTQYQQQALAEPRG